jgi:AbrB family looped-hinge helix DNA binding protein
VAADVTTMSPNGQVVIPKKIREKLGLQPGEELIAMDVAGRIVLTPARGEAIRAELEGILRSFDQALDKRAARADPVKLVRKLRDAGD